MDTSFRQNMREKRANFISIHYANLNNSKQLIVAWLMYASDYQERFVNNHGDDGVRGTRNSWINNPFDTTIEVQVHSTVQTALFDRLPACSGIHRRFRRPIQVFAQKIKRAFAVDAVAALEEFDLRSVRQAQL